MTKGVIETNKGNIEFELFDEATPNTVKNFVTLVEKNYYNGLTFHRVIPEFVVQGGCPHGSGTGGPGYAIPCETDRPMQKHVLGAFSMAHAGRDTGGSQFFIVLNPDNCKHLDGKHTVFGRVTAGIDVVRILTQGDRMNRIIVSEVPASIQDAELHTLSGRR
ncbi:MAG: peptidylprolyl isomerase [Candidatus Heimdallarchaeota archaeon]